MQPQSVSAGAKGASRDIFHELSKLAKLAGEVLDASSTLLGRAQALVRAGVDEGGRATESLSEILKRLEAGTPLPARRRVSARELTAAREQARGLMLRAGETVLRVQSLVGHETTAERYHWRGGPTGPSMTRLHACLDQLVQWVAEAAVVSLVAQHEIRSMERGFLTMRNVARHHREVANDTIVTAKKLQAQAIRFVRLLEQAEL